MARMPGAEWLPANDGNSTMNMDRWDIVCIHTIVGYAPAKAAHFSTNAAGYLWQHRDTTKQSAANYQGNHRVIAIENEDSGPPYGSWSGSNVPRFTSPQAETIARVLAWANQVHGIPLVPCPDSRPGSRGIAYHRQGIDSDNNFAGYAYGGRVSGGEVWSLSKGKICPGDARISQLLNEIIPRAKALANGEDNELTPDEHGALDKLYKGFYSGPNGSPGGILLDAIVDRVYDRVMKTQFDRPAGTYGAEDGGGKISLEGVVQYWAANTDRLPERVAEKVKETP